MDYTAHKFATHLRCRGVRVTTEDITGEDPVTIVDAFHSDLVVTAFFRPQGRFIEARFSRWGALRIARTRSLKRAIDALDLPATG
jgi:hypothetical protein